MIICERVVKALKDYLTNRPALFKKVEWRIRINQ